MVKFRYKKLTKSLFKLACEIDCNHEIMNYGQNVWKEVEHQFDLNVCNQSIRFYQFNQIIKFLYVQNGDVCLNFWLNTVMILLFQERKEQTFELEIVNYGHRLHFFLGSFQIFLWVGVHCLFSVVIVSRTVSTVFGISLRDEGNNKETATSKQKNQTKDQTEWSWNESETNY